jgi:very-short-patch-repair endonuclease
MTGAEIRLWSQLRGKQFEALKFRRQHGIGPYIVDFYCPERAVVIEVDGDNHAETRQVIKDRKRDRYLEALGLRVIRYTNDDVLNNVEGVMETLVKELGEWASPAIERTS